MRSLTIISSSLAVFIAVSCSAGGAGYPSDVKDILEELDNTLEKKGEYEAAKERKIRKIRSRLSPESSMTEKYEVYDALYDEYYKFDLDSAMFYARAKSDIARQSGEQNLIDDAVLDIADRYVLSGMYSGAIKLMENMEVSRLDYVLQPRYYHIYNSLYNGMAEACDDMILRKEYKEKRDYYRERLVERLGEDDISRLYVMSDIMTDSGKADEILDDLLSAYSSPDITINGKAVLSYIIANAYQMTGETDKAIFHYAESAVNDLKIPINEYKSLYELAALLYEKGDVKRAYRYITRSVNDAMTANARINIQSINRLLPIISKSYNIQMRKDKRKLGYMLGGISVLTLLLAVAIGIVVRMMKDASVAEKKARKKNEELHMLNGRLQEYISLLQEANNIKESYLGRYLDMCSDYIEGLEKYRSQLRKAAKNEGFAGIMEMLRDNDYIEKELQEFYARFDATFLHLFPDFVSQLNALLQPDRQIEDKSRENILSTEIRVAALIRLGVDDSVKIAHFLRRSTSTIYNYRVKMRNAALKDREDFENQLMHIGRLS